MLLRVRDALAKEYLLDRPRGKRPFPPPHATPDPRRNVVGVGIGRRRVRGEATRELCVTIFVAKKFPPAAVPRKFRLPTEVQGVPIDVVEMGIPRALGASPDGDGESNLAPAQPGSAVCTRFQWPDPGTITGTLSAVGRVSDDAPVDGATDSSAVFFPRVRRSPPTPGQADYLLGCNHVFADENRALLGTPILYPALGGPDGGLSTTIAKLEGFVKLEDERPNLMDAAWARITREELVSPVFPSPIGELATGTPVALTEWPYGFEVPVEMVGGATGYLVGHVAWTELVISVEYRQRTGLSVYRMFWDQLVFEWEEGQPAPVDGDSGSVLVHRTKKAPVAMLFAASLYYGVATPLHRMFSLVKNLGVSIVTS